MTTKLDIARAIIAFKAAQSKLAQAIDILESSKDKPRYEVKFYSGSYLDRQREANKDKAICYVEQHFNSAINPSTNYSRVIVGSNASLASKMWGSSLAKAYNHAFNIRMFGNYGLVIGGPDGRGDWDIKYTAMPALLLEPLFASSYDGSTVLKTEHGRALLAEILANSIRDEFPDGGLVAFSVGHKGNPDNPRDMGALVLGGGTEAQYAEEVLNLAADMLMGIA